MSFHLHSEYLPTGDQPGAVKRLVEGFRAGQRRQTLLGVTGSGKTFTMAHVAAQLNRPVLVLSHNKTLAAQLYREFKDLFPENAVEYFVSYYDYYQPEAYIPRTDTYIEKDASINEELDRVRLAATSSLLERSDVIVVASVSCIYGIGSPQEQHDLAVEIAVGEELERDEFLRALAAIQYERNDAAFYRATFRVRGDVVDVHRGADEKTALRVEFFGDEIEAISVIDPLRGTRLQSLESATIFPATHFVTSRPNLERAMQSIRVELNERLEVLNAEGKHLEAQRLEQRTRYDLEMLDEMGYCMGIENYSRHMEGRRAGDPPFTLLDYFPDDFLLFVDESHVTIPQVHAMFNGDQSRKRSLVEHGFRLPSALDNRPLRFEEFERKIGRTLFVSATPGQWELEQSQGVVVELVNRPTGLLEPVVEVRPAARQVDDLLDEIRRRVERKERVLVTTLTKRMAEDLSQYYGELGVKVRYLHADIDTFERVEIIRDLRRGEFDVLIGVNLLREGLDLPEVSLVAVMDADKEGFLRNRTSLVQTCGRAARNLEGRVLLYADRETRSMREAMDEMRRRRLVQEAYNREHGITPRGIVKRIGDILERRKPATESEEEPPLLVADSAGVRWNSPRDLKKRIEKTRKDMEAAAANLEFERAAELRDALFELEKRELEV